VSPPHRDSGAGALSTENFFPGVYNTAASKVKVYEFSDRNPAARFTKPPLRVSFTRIK
jgi:hypothetical protein